MIVDITSIAALIVALYMLFWGIAIIFKLRLVSWAAASRKNLCIKFRDIFNVVPKKFANFYVSTTEKCNCESKIWMKYGANLLEKSH